MSQRQLSHTWLRFVWLQSAFLLAACAHLENRRPETQQERAHSVAAAVADIVDARCELEEHCANIGPGQKFDSRAACGSKMQGETAVTLNTADCPLGVERRKLDACVSSILAQDCGNMFDALSRWNACRDGQICYQ
jgi:hypothetical protein